MLIKFISIFFFFIAVSFAQNDLNNRFMLANSYEQAGEYLKAKTILEELYSLQPENYQFFDALNRVYTQLKNYAESEQIIKKKISSSPNDVNLYGLLGKTYHMMGDENKAFETWNRAIEISNYNPAVYRLVSNYAVERRDFSFAIDVLKRGKEKTPDPLMFSYELANLYSLTMNFTGAASEYIEILKKLPGENLNVRQRLSTITGKPEAIKQTVAVFEKEANTPEVKSILAWLYTENKNFDKAHKLFKELDDERGSSGADIFGFAQHLYGLKEYKFAAEVYSEIMKNSGSPFINAAKLGYAKSTEELIKTDYHVSSGAWKPLKKTVLINNPDIDRLVKTYLELSNQVANNDVLNEASFRAARILKNFKNEPDEAEKLFRRIVDNSPVSLFAGESILELARLNLKKGNLDEAIELLKKAQVLPRATEEQKNQAKLIMAEIHFYRKDLESSQKMLSQVLGNLKDNSANDAIELSLILNTKMNDSLALLSYAEAEFLSIQEKFDEAKTKYSSIPTDKAGFLLGSLIDLRKAEVELGLDNIQGSVDILEKLSAEDSGNIYADKALYLLGNIFEYSIDDPQKAIGIYEKLLAKFPRSMYLDEAREHIINLKNKVS
jgi:tetratricopeptide (TPR) repeat protein